MRTDFGKIYDHANRRNNWDNPDSLGWQLWLRNRNSSLASESIQLQVERFRSNGLFRLPSLADDIQKRWLINRQQGPFPFNSELPLFSARYSLPYTQNPARHFQAYPQQVKNPPAHPLSSRHYSPGFATAAPRITSFSDHNILRKKVAAGPANNGNSTVNSSISIGHSTDHREGFTSSDETIFPAIDRKEVIEVDPLSFIPDKTSHQDVSATSLTKEPFSSPHVGQLPENVQQKKVIQKNSETAIPLGGKPQVEVRSTESLFKFPSQKGFVPKDIVQHILRRKPVPSRFRSVSPGKTQDRSPIYFTAHLNLSDSIFRNTAPLLFRTPTQIIKTHLKNGRADSPGTLLDQEYPNLTVQKEKSPSRIKTVMKKLSNSSTQLADKSSARQSKNEIAGDSNNSAAPPKQHLIVAEESITEHVPAAIAASPSQPPFSSFTFQPVQRAGRVAESSRSQDTTLSNFNDNKKITDLSDDINKTKKELPSSLASSSPARSHSSHSSPSLAYSMPNRTSSLYFPNLLTGSATTPSVMSFTEHQLLPRYSRLSLLANDVFNKDNVRTFSPSLSANVLPISSPPFSSFTPQTVQRAGRVTESSKSRDTSLPNSNDNNKITDLSDDINKTERERPSALAPSSPARSHLAHSLSSLAYSMPNRTSSLYFPNLVKGPATTPSVMSFTEHQLLPRYSRLSLLANDVSNKDNVRTLSPSLSALVLPHTEPSVKNNDFLGTNDPNNIADIFMTSQQPHSILERATIGKSKENLQQSKRVTNKIKEDTQSGKSQEVRRHFGIDSLAHLSDSWVLKGKTPNFSNNSPKQRINTSPQRIALPQRLTFSQLRRKSTGPETKEGFNVPYNLTIRQKSSAHTGPTFVYGQIQHPANLRAAENHILPGEAGTIPFTITRQDSAPRAQRTIERHENVPSYPGNQQSIAGHHINNQISHLANSKLLLQRSAPPIVDRPFFQKTIQTHLRDESSKVKSFTEHDMPLASMTYSQGRAHSLSNDAGDDQRVQTSPLNLAESTPTAGVISAPLAETGAKDSTSNMQTGHPQAAMEIDKIVEKTWLKLMRKLTIERERRGLHKWI